MNVFSQALDFAFSPYKIGFVRPHTYLNDLQVREIGAAIGEEDDWKTIGEYNRKMSSLIGSGRGLSFATGRMAFFSLLKQFGVKEGDEVVLLGFTCAAMPDAVMRTGATPVFADVDRETFGSGVEGIKKKITKKTKVVVAQHSFGTPCRIDEIAELCKEKSIILIEDCAITLDSSYRKKTVGNFGDASIFSSDHTKPTNTIIGGFCYAKDRETYEKINAGYSKIRTLDTGHQKRLYSRLVYERSNYTPPRYPRAMLREKFGRLFGKLLPGEKPLDYINDFCPPKRRADYPYPARMPSFLCKLGILELERWKLEKRNRKNILGRFVEISEQSGKIDLPEVYQDKDFDIVPLRFALDDKTRANLIERIASYVDVGWTWYRQPILGCHPAAFGYQPGSCHNSEALCQSIINLPCVVDEKWDETLLEQYERTLKGL